jgi:hypothetical protein
MKELFLAQNDSETPKLESQLDKCISLMRYKYLFFSLLCLLLAGCGRPFRRLINDEVFLRDGSSVTGTISSADSASVTLQKSDLSRQVIGWQQIDSIGSASHRTMMLGGALGLFSTPYYSAFQGEAYQPTGVGLVLRAGTVSFGKTYKYVNLSFLSGRPYGVTKLGVGIQRHLKLRYVDAWSPFLGLEANLMFVKNNNSPSFTLDPFLGGDLRLSPQVRLMGRLGFQLNPASAANPLGANLSAGVTYQWRNFSAHNSHLLRHHQLPRRFNP